MCIRSWKPIDNLRELVKVSEVAKFGKPDVKKIHFDYDVT